MWRMENVDRYQGPEALAGDSIFAVRDTNEKKTLIKLSLKEGRPGLKVSLPGHARDMAVSPGYVFILFSSGEIRAYSDSTLTPLWKAPVLASANIPRLIAVGGRLVASIESRVYCFEMSSGKPLWTYDEPYHSTPYASVTGERLLLRRSVIDLATGSRLWQLPHYPNWMALARTSVISEEGDRLVVRDLEHGGARHNNPGGNLIGAGQYPGPQWENGQFLLTQNKMYRPSTFGNDLREHVRAIDSEGKIVWEIPGALPVTVDPWLTVGYDGLRRYVPGRIAETPTEPKARKVRARELASRFSELDAEERYRLEELAPEIVEPLMKEAAAAAIRSSNQSLPPDVQSSSRTEAHNAFHLLRPLAKPANAEAALAGMQAVGRKNEFFGYFQAMLAQMKRHDLDIGPLIRFVGENGLDKDSQTTEIVLRSHRPEAVELAFRVFKSRNPRWWGSAYHGLSRNTNPAVLKRLAALRPQGPALPWERRPIIPGETAGEGLDPQGRRCQFFTSDILGNYTDLFMRRRIGNSWGVPIFMGIETYPAEDGAYGLGIPAEDVFKRRREEWLRAFTQDPNLTKDTDADGLADLVERRWGTRPDDPDSDEDGLKDGVDPAPLAKPRKIRLVESAIQEALNLKTAGIRSGSLIIATPGIEHFQLAAFASPVLWAGEKKPADMTLTAMLSSKADSAVVTILGGGRESGSQDVHLRKVNGRWFASAASE